MQTPNTPPSDEQKNFPAPDASLSAEQEENNAVGAETEEDTADLVAMMEFSHPADIAEQIEDLSLEKQVEVICSLPEADAAETLAEMDEFHRVNLLETLSPEKAADILGEMSPDDAADILEELHTAHTNALLDRLKAEDAEEIRNLMAFDPDTAGGVMNTEVIILEHDLAADQAISQWRREIVDKEVPFYAYIVNAQYVLLGVLSLRDLFLLPPGKTIGDAVGSQELITVTFNQGREEVARVMAHYNFMALPVVDMEGRILGVISHDDVIDIMNDLASEDMLGMVGAGQDETTDTPWRTSVHMRLPWLLVNILNSSLSAFVVYLFEGTIAQMTILAVFMPIVANQAGNTGQQALAVIIRQLATERFERRRAWIAVLREGKIGLMNGLLLGILVGIAVGLFTGDTPLTCVMVSALILDMCLGALAGASIPLIFKEMGRDPAQASSIFLTAITDGAGFFLFLGLATIFLL